MKITTLITITLLFFAVSGCGAGGDPIFSPDPSIGDEAVGGGEENPEGGGAETSPTPEEDKGAIEEEERDCFLDGFCYRECASASECPDGFSCVMNVCTFDCQSDDECGNGGVCNSMGLCEVAEGEGIPACTSDGECGDGRFCNDAGECEQIAVILGCQSDVDCPLGQYCDDQHACQLFPGPGVECSVDEDCPGDYYCDALSECAQECRSSYQCAEGEACDGAGRCVAVGAPTSIVRFSFSSVGSDTDPSASPSFLSPSFRITNVNVTPAGRNKVLTSQNYRLTGSMNY